ncbi:BA14K family protein [Pseudochrobactrum sp. HB0163]|uniref:BA14K family protein n=1 Tax=Pseudochrobactrum sp. HB0163 TaxID=3450708 RepID=UPI003F6E0E9E
MRKLVSYFTTALAAIIMGLLSFSPATQAQSAPSAHMTISPDDNARQGMIRHTQYYSERHSSKRRSHRHGHWRHHRPYYRPYYRPYHKPYYRPYYQPHYRYYRPAPPRYYRERVIRPGRNAHINWCYNRYRSYRASDNTFQPHYGPRRQCYSPYI